MNDIINEIRGEESIDIKDFADTTQYPGFDIGQLTDIFLLDGISEFYRKEYFDYYNYQGIGVPRVTNVIKQCLDNSLLIDWASRLGYKKYKIEQNKALTIGNKTHELIEEFLLTGKFNDNSFHKVNPVIKRNISVAFNNFKDWMNDLSDHGYFITDIIAIEKPISCPYFGGTIDCICRINGKVYIVDFKTSKRILPEYMLQVCAYMWACNSGYVDNIPMIDGVGIIRVDKFDNNCYNDMFLNTNIPWQAELINKYMNDFGILLHSYYTVLSMEEKFPNIRKSVSNTYDVLGGVYDK